MSLSRFITHMYCAECIVMMDKIEVATIIHHVNPLLMARLNTEELERQPSPGWKCTTREYAKSIQQYNAVVCMLMVNGYSNAGRLVNLGFHPDVMDHVMKLKVYLESHEQSSATLSQIEENK